MTQNRPLAPELLDDLLATLEAVATGSYLRPEERQYWEQPFPANAVGELEAILRGFLKQTYEVGVDPSQTTAELIETLDAFNERYFWMVIDNEEEVELHQFIEVAWQDAGYGNIGELPAFGGDEATED
ncbi:hypothetical protein NQ024_03145 [Corynebacterium sp. 35RC1]|nr:hypothetical protein [Corynebacterium sp. 35RC1]